MVDCHSVPGITLPPGDANIFFHCNLGLCSGCEEEAGVDTCTYLARFSQFVPPSRNLPRDDSLKDALRQRDARSIVACKTTGAAQCRRRRATSAQRTREPDQTCCLRPSSPWWPAIAQITQQTESCSGDLTDSNAANAEGPRTSTPKGSAHFLWVA
ncbi:hypothetical protein BT67DRAFT_296369 [Trichocladium antarcticum]|uniref:Uncharacterized protein n=1 Tax=Trichocladium antarcticum TaxID=1450529 RepID=A0AAN6UKM5_9PEZI|nr:hypothetical protein BT67DRAFT_296369 [Trichocladium antarcticum]